MKPSIENPTLVKINLLLTISFSFLWYHYFYCQSSCNNKLSTTPQALQTLIHTHQFLQKIEELYPLLELIALFNYSSLSVAGKQERKRDEVIL